MHILFVYRADVDLVCKTAPCQYYSLQFLAMKSHFFSQCIYLTMFYLCSVFRRSELVSSDHRVSILVSKIQSTVTLLYILQRCLIIHNIIWIWLFYSTLSINEPTQRWGCCLERYGFVSSLKWQSAKISL